MGVEAKYTDWRVGDDIAERRRGLVWEAIEGDAVALRSS
jgi:hypothetical protein